MIYPVPENSWESFRTGRQMQRLSFLELRKAEKQRNDSLQCIHPPLGLKNTLHSVRIKVQLTR